jgi:hypothetical protein
MMNELDEESLCVLLDRLSAGSAPPAEGLQRPDISGNFGTRRLYQRLACMPSLSHVVLGSTLGRLSDWDVEGSSATEDESASRFFPRLVCLQLEVFTNAHPLAQELLARLQGLTSLEVQSKFVAAQHKSSILDVWCFAFLVTQRQAHEMDDTDSEAGSNSGSDSSGQVSSLPKGSNSDSSSEGEQGCDM